MSFGSSQICLRNVAFRLYVCMYVYTYVSVCIYVRMSVCVYVCQYVQYECTYEWMDALKFMRNSHTHTQTHTHTHTHTHTVLCA
jgi:hypothetical protein